MLLYTHLQQRPQIQLCDIQQGTLSNSFIDSYQLNVYDSVESVLTEGSLKEDSNGYLVCTSNGKCALYNCSNF